MCCQGYSSWVLLPNFVVVEMFSGLLIDVAVWLCCHSVLLIDRRQKRDRCDVMMSTAFQVADFLILGQLPKYMGRNRH
jgi:hypothetical protein